MRKISLCISLLILACTAYAQTLTMDQVPGVVSHAFHTKYPSAQQESWQLVAKGTYEVAFFTTKKSQTASFDQSGKWLRTETDVTKSPPKNILNGIAKNFPGFDIQTVSQVESADGSVTYEAVVFQGSENYDATFSTKGQLLKKEAGQTNQ